MPTKQATKRARKPTRKAPARKAARKSTGRQPGKMSTAAASQMTEKTRITKTVRTYLDAIRAGSAGAALDVAVLSGIPGFKGKCADPDKIDAAVNALGALADQQTSSIRELAMRQRIRDLRAAAITIRERSNGDSPESRFVAVAKVWADSQAPRVSYEAFREVGVPHRVLKAAGITPTTRGAA